VPRIFVSLIVIIYHFTQRLSTAVVSIADKW